MRGLEVESWNGVGVVNIRRDVFSPGCCRCGVRVVVVLLVVSLVVVVLGLIVVDAGDAILPEAVKGVMLDDAALPALPGILASFPCTNSSAVLGDLTEEPSTTFFIEVAVIGGGES